MNDLITTFGVKKVSSILLTMVLYIAVAWYGTWISTNLPFSTNLVWFSPGVGLIAFLAFGNLAIPIVFLSSFLAHYGPSIPCDFSWGILETTEAWLAWRLLPNRENFLIQDRATFFKFFWRSAVLPALSISWAVVWVHRSCNHLEIPHTLVAWIAIFVQESVDDILGIVAITPLFLVIRERGVGAAIKLGFSVAGWLIVPMAGIFLTHNALSTILLVFIIIGIILYIAVTEMFHGAAWAFVCVSVFSMAFITFGEGRKFAIESHLEYTHFLFVILCFGVFPYYISLTLKEFHRLKDSLEEQVISRTKELTQANKYLAEIAFLDSLTGLSNRRAFMPRIQAEHARAQRSHRPYAFAILDLDHFKRINDTYGHQAGDLVLATFATILQSNIRNLDMAARWGGEEFAILFPEAASDSCSIALERIRKSLEAQPISSQEHFIQVTVSIGVTHFYPGDTDANQVFQRADRALYSAKENGRNRLVFEGVEKSPIVVPLELAWHPTYLSGHEGIDAQHQSLFRMVNELFAVCTDPIEEVMYVTNRMVAEVIVHFEEEEEILSKISYQKLEEHRKSHQHLLAQTELLVEKLRNREIEAKILFEFMGYEVFAKHILKVDQNYFPDLQKALREGLIL
ncbi:membrane hypothetical protein [Gammaproteobacteria bacterium]